MYYIHVVYTLFSVGAYASVADDKIRGEKWTWEFQLLDINGDGMISTGDFYDLQQSFRVIYKPDDTQTKRMMAELFQFWRKAIFLQDAPDWDSSFSQGEFIAIRREAYAKNSVLIMELGGQAIGHLWRAADINNMGSFSFKDYQRFKSACKVTDKALVKILFDLISNGSGAVTEEKMIRFYSELIFGNDRERHEKYKAVLFGFL